MANFPEVTFMSHDTPTLKIINEPDLDLEAMLKRVGLGDVKISASTDRAEITGRQGVFQFFHKNPKFADWLQSNRSKVRKIPTEPAKFLRELHAEAKHGSRFLDDLKCGLMLMEKSRTLPPRLAVFRDFVASTFAEAEQDERLLSEKVSVEILKASQFWGSFDCEVDAFQEVKMGDLRGGGFRLYGYDQFKGKKWDFPEKIRELPLIGPFCQFLETNQNRLIELRRFGPQKLGTQHLEGHHLQGMFKRLVTEALPSSEVWGKVWSNRLGSGEKVKFSVYFQFANGELHMRVVNMQLTRPSYAYEESSVGSDDMFSSKQRIHAEFKGFSWLERRRMRELKRLITNNVTETGYRQFGAMHLHAALVENPKMLELMGSGVTVTDDLLVEHFGGKNVIPGLFNPAEHYNICAIQKRVNAYRTWVCQKLDDLEEMADIISKMKRKAASWKIPLSFPEVLADDVHEIQSGCLYPISLIGRNNQNGAVLKAKDLVPIDGLPKLNGVPVGMTGQNAGGKTVSAEEVAWSVWLAQAGLPIFGKSFALNPKHVLAPVFIERGDGSTAQLLVRKLERLVSEAKQHDPNRILAIIDELGGATGHDDGTRLGIRVLTELKNLGCSVMFNTQIGNVAQYASDQLGALVYQVDLNHRIRPGVGKSNLDALIDAEGLGKLLPQIEETPKTSQYLH